MNLTVHRGTYQIGGCITELRTSATRTVIDMGCPLPAPERAALERYLSTTQSSPHVILGA